jgi:D-alanyl-D-alanine carboxypeptidase (penicillin-binding protein 5/6)
MKKIPVSLTALTVALLMTTTLGAHALAAAKQPAAKAPVVAAFPSAPAPVTPSGSLGAASGVPAPMALDVAARQVYLVDAATGVQMYGRNADERMAPSSMTKLMTMYLVFEAIKSGKLHMDDTLTVSEHAWRQGQDGSSTMFLNIGQNVRVEDLIRGVIIQSGNDASTVLAEKLGDGSEGAFTDRMNEKAAQLGMAGSHFTNASGLPDPQNYSTAHDLGTLALALMRDFPEDYHYFSEENFAYNGHPQGNRNPLLYRNLNVDGLKTGHTEEGGYGLTASAIRDGRRVVLVLNGMQDMQARADESAKVLDYAYREYGDYPVAKAGDMMGNARVWLGTDKVVPVVVQDDALLTLPRAARTGLKAVAVFNQPLQAPVVKGQQIGQLVISAPGTKDTVVPLVAGADDPQVGFFARVIDKLGVIFGGKA